jgi:hypothetical protein
MMDNIPQDALQAAAEAWEQTEPRYAVNEEFMAIRHALEEKYRRVYPLFDSVELPDNVGVYGLPENHGHILMTISRITYGSVGSVQHTDLFLRTPNGPRLLKMLGVEGGL